MPKCIFCKKSHLKGYRKCEITGQIKKHECIEYYTYCKHFKLSLYERLKKWLDNILY